MSANYPNELPRGVVTGEYVKLDVDLFLKAFSTMLQVMTGKLPCAEGFALGLRVGGDGLPAVVLEETPLNRGMYTGARLFPDAAQRLSFLWRAAVVLSIAMDEKYRNYRNDTADTINFTLVATVAMVRGSERATKKELRASFDAMFRVLKAAEDWAAVNPGKLQLH